VQTYLINLHRETERRAFMESQFKALGISYERIEAVKASDITMSYLLDTVRPDGRWLGQKSGACIKSASGQGMLALPLLGRYITSSEVACYMSHRKAIARFVDSGSSRTCIFEDDVELGDDLVAILEAIAGKTDYAIVKLHGILPYHFDIGQRVMDLSNWSVRFRFKPSTGASAYFITRAAAVTLLASLSPIREPYDNWLRQYWRHGIPVYELSPFAVKQATKFQSTITERDLSVQPSVEFTRIARMMLAPIKFWYKTLRVLRRLAFFIRMGGKLR
jgi:GR25 family glycosyltransferase involved in LPS biosynthesis